MNETVNKSMIYGNVKKNNYGRFIPICAAINEAAQIKSILEYVSQTDMFNQYNRKAYAFRIEEAPEVFLTEKNNQRLKYQEGSHSDQTIEGSGQKLLHLLQKLNIKNIFVAILIDQYDPLRRFDSTNYRMIVENSKELLNVLYKKVQSTEEFQFQLPKANFQKEPEIRKCNIGDQVEFAEKKLPKERPNHIYSGGKPQFLQQGSGGKPKVKGSQIKFLKQRISSYEVQFKKVKQSFSEKDFEHLKYTVIFQKSIVAQQIFQMLSIVMGMNMQELQNKYDFKQLMNLQLLVVDDKKLKKLSGYLISNRQLTVDITMKMNRALGLVFSIIQLIIRKNKSNNRLSQLINQKQ